MSSVDINARTCNVNFILQSDPHAQRCVKRRRDAGSQSPHTSLKRPKYHEENFHPGSPISLEVSLAERQRGQVIELDIPVRFHVSIQEYAPIYALNIMLHRCGGHLPWKYRQ